MDGMYGWMDGMGWDGICCEGLTDGGGGVLDGMDGLGGAGGN